LGLSLLGLAVLAILDIFFTKDFSGGRLGWVIAFLFLKYLGRGASLVLFFALFVVSLLIAFDIPLKKSLVAKKEETEEIQEIEEEEKTPGEKKSLLEILLPKKPRTQKPKLAPKAGLPPKTGYSPPPLDILENASSKPKSGDISANKKIIEKTLSDFGIEVEMGQVNVGPSVSQYTLKPPSGINLTKIVSLKRNLAMALAAHPIRIEAPIPGTHLLGIEVPNKYSSTVRLKPLLKLLAGRKTDSSLMLALGRNVSGNAVFVDLAKMPHLLIAGATGSGKSVCINNLILTLIYQNSPQNLQFILIDPKRVELTPYDGIPHLLAPVVVDARKAIASLKWAIAEMERRYKVLSSMGARDIKSFNKKAQRQDIKPLAYIVIVIDEMADLMTVYKKEMEAAVVRLAQMARAVGIHLIASTQRPSTEVVTGLIKANITNRIAFKVASQVDSRTILDRAGAESLLGNGDMLYMSGGASGLRRIQGVFVSETEVLRVVNWLKKEKLPGREEAIPDFSLDFEREKEVPSFTKMDTEDFEFDDDLYPQAKEIVIAAGKGSASLLQRRLSIGYARAARLLDMLEKAGVVGPAEGSKPRKLLSKN